MAKKKSVIPLYSMEGSVSPGIEVKRITDISAEDTPALNTAHRDDHYIFLFLEKGAGKMMVDFKEISVNGSGVFCILPGQVHYGVLMEHADVWFLALENDLVSEQFRLVFEDHQQLVKTGEAEVARLRACISLLCELSVDTKQHHFQQTVIRSLTDAYLGMLAGIFSAAGGTTAAQVSRGAVITRQFKQLLARSFRTMKSPAAYAAALNISPSYLNEVVKTVTGLPVSHWIQEEAMTEARRLLYYTDNTVKQVADELGYEHTYFSRIFTRTAGMSPLAFRKKYRE